MAISTKVTAKLGNDESILRELQSQGFSEEIKERPRRLIVSSSGREKVGKSHFALTAPDPIIYLNVDLGTEGVVDKFQHAGKRVLLYDVRVPKESGSKDVYVSLWADLKSKIIKAYSLRKGSVIWDTSSECFELARLAKFGKLTQVMPHQYTEVNNEWRELLRTAYDSSMNTVFIHKMKPVWINNVRTKDYELSGFTEMDYLSQVNIIHFREDTEEGTVYSVLIKDSRHRPGLAGQVLRGLPLVSGEERTSDPLCNFELLLSLVHDK
jgi:hypothetical protein